MKRNALKTGRTVAFCLLILWPYTGLPPQAQESLSGGHPKYQTIRRVFDDLIRAIGDGRTKPTLYVLSRNTRGLRQVAWYVPRDNAITVEERVYDLFVSLGSDSLNALAWLLGHELSHYYKDHGWISDFGNRLDDLPVAQELQGLRQNPSKLVEIETEADYFGGMAGYIAGYNSLGVGPEVLRLIYDEFGLDEELPGYPSLVERQEIARSSQEQLSEMIPVFQAGHSLLLVKQYEPAARCFDFIARTFPSREILNNAGVARALEALDLFEKGYLRFVYPFELDPETRLRGIQVKGEDFAETVPDRRKRLLEEARESFDNACRRDSNYAPAAVNLACVLDLQGKHPKAIAFAEEALAIARRNGEALPLAHAFTARGIIRAHAEPADEEGARRDFEQAGPGSQALARMNLAVLDGEAVRPEDPRLSPDGEPALPPERIAGQTAQGYAEVMIPDEVVSVPGTDRTEVTIYSSQGDGWEGLVVNPGRKKTIAILATSENYPGQTNQDIRTGSTAAQVGDRYGMPNYLISGRLGTYHVYTRAGIIFHIAADSVQNWTVYHVKE